MRKNCSSGTATAVLLVLVTILACRVFAEQAPVPEKGGKQKKLFSPSRMYFLDAPERNRWQQPDKVLETWGVKKGETVADVGAGSGYFTLRLAEKVGPEGRVYAVDIQQAMLDHINRKIEENRIKNILLVRSTDFDPNLPPSCCDKIMLVDTYKELKYPEKFMARLKDALRPGGEIAVIDFHTGKVGPPVHFRVPVGEVITQMTGLGYALVKRYDFLEHQFFLVFR